MLSNTALARREAKALIMALGRKNILNKHINELASRTGLGACDIQNGFSYFDYSPAQANFRALYYK